MRFSVISAFPEMFEAISQYGITRRALTNKLIKLDCFNPRDYTENKHKTIDDRPFGGGPGMVLSPEPLHKAIQAAKRQHSGSPWVIELSPKGKPIKQKKIQELQLKKSIILVCGRYEGIDERITTLDVDEQLSLGDYVLSGGELGAMIIIDAITRLIPGALGHDKSAEYDSFSEDLLDCPHYTRPENFKGLKVPDVLLSGDHKAIERWRQQQALGHTWERRPDLLDATSLTCKQKDLLDEYINTRGLEHEK